MSDELVSHVRYPEDLFKVQRDILTRYHVDDAGRLLQPERPVADPGRPDATAAPTAQPPYYILAQRPGDDGASFQLTSALNAFNRENLSAFISASCDPESYGEMQVLRLPGNTPVPGAAAGAERLHLERPGASNLTLFDSGNSDAVFGNLLTLPIGDAGLLYVEPLYVQGPVDNGFPLLQKVMVNYRGPDRVRRHPRRRAGPGVRRRGRGGRRTDSDDDPGHRRGRRHRARRPRRRRRPTHRRRRTAGAARRSATRRPPRRSRRSTQALQALADRAGVGRLRRGRRGPAGPGRRPSAAFQAAQAAAAAGSGAAAEPDGRARVPGPPRTRLVGWSYRRGVEQLGSSLGS